MSDPSPDGCAVCGASPVEKVLFPVAVHFKGSGFYATDYGRGNKRRDGGDTDGGTASDAKAGDSKSDGKGEKSDKPMKSDKPAKAET